MGKNVQEFLKGVQAMLDLAATTDDPRTRFVTIVAARNAVRAVLDGRVE